MKLLTREEFLSTGKGGRTSLQRGWQPSGSSFWWAVMSSPQKKSISVLIFFFFKISPTSLLHWQMFVLCEATCRALCMLSLCVALFSWWIWEVNTPPSLEPCFRDLSRRNPHVSFDFLLSLPCTNSFSLCASSWLIGGQRWTQWCCSEDKNQLVVISWVLMTDVLPLFSLLAFSSTISKHFTNVTYVDLVGKKNTCSGKNCKFDLEWWSQYWRAEISWPTSLGLLIFLGCCPGFLKAFVKKMTIPSEVSRF